MAVLTVGVCVALVLRFALPLFQYLPKCALSAIVVVALTTLADPDEARSESHPAFRIPPPPNLLFERYTRLDPL